MKTTQLTSENAQSLFDDLRPLFARTRFFVAITGAGISKASGLPLLNDVVHGIPLKRFFEPGLFESDPALYYNVYREALISWRAAKPNRAHFALARAGVWVITQNVDGLHRDAGTRHLLELHGNFRELRCPSCGLIRDSSIVHKDAVPVCETCQSALKPGIVLEGEEVRHYSRAVDWVGRAEILLIIGTQLQMSPVCDLERIAEEAGAKIIWINDEADRWVPRLLDSWS